MSTATKRSGRAETPRQDKDKEKKDDEPKDKEEKAKSGGMMGWIKVAVAVAALFAAYKFLGDKVNVKEGLEQAVDFVEKQGDIAVYWYVLFTFVGVVCLVPTTPMEIAGGFLFIRKYGFWVYVFTGGAKLCANIVSVLLAKFVFRDRVNKWIDNAGGKVGKLMKIVREAVDDEPWKMAFLVRGSMVPLCVKNYGLGVTNIGYLPNACCSMIFTNFYAAQNIYMGSTMQNLKEVFAPKKAAAGPTDWTQTAKTLMPVLFNVLLVAFLVKAIMAQVKKSTEKIEKEKEEKNKKTS